MDIGHRVASAVLKHYQDVVPRKWKPRNGEWTVLSAFILEDVGSGTLEVVSLGSGTKCLGVTQLSLQGDAIHDSHGEVLARRGFKRYLLSEVLKFNESKTGILGSKEDFKAFPKKIHFFSTRLPCGDATIIPMIADGPSKSKKSRVEGPDIHRTGAKCVANQVMMDEHLPGVGYHVVGAVRTKPGRGSPTKSLSCSDKMLKWNYFGTCGDILKRFWFPSGLHWSSITINCQIEDKDSIKESLQRALIDRCSAPFDDPSPLICTSHLSFEYDLKMDESNKASPCANSICWSKVANEPLAMLSEGRKFGLAKKHYSSRKSILPISRLKLAEFALHIMMQEKSDRISYIWSKKNIKYSDMKPSKETDLRLVMPQLWPDKTLKGINEFLVKKMQVTIISNEDSSPYMNTLRNEFFLSFIKPNTHSIEEMQQIFCKLKFDPVIIHKDCIINDIDCFDKKAGYNPTWIIITESDNNEKDKSESLFHKYIYRKDKRFQIKLIEQLRFIVHGYETN